MKAFLLAASALVACACSSFAQNLPPDYLWEVGFNAGRSTFTRPDGPAPMYTGTRTKTVNDRSLHLNYYPDVHWMLSLDIGERQWTSYGDWTPNDQLGVVLKPRPITFVIADHAVNENVGINYVIPFYSRYNTYNKANLYFGVNFGLMQTSNDGSTAFSTYKAAPDSSFTYLSKYDYGAGTGINAGIQIGYTWYVIPRLGINLELGMRYAHITTNDSRFAGANNMFNLLYFPETLGVRWRF